MGVDPETAEALVNAGFSTPRKIKAASNAQIEAVPGIGKAKREELRRTIPSPRR
jgi:ERCC4-type nuclease